MKKFILLIFIILALNFRIQAKPVNEEYHSNESNKSGDFENDTKEELKTVNTEAESKESSSESDGITKRESNPNSDSEERLSFTEALKDASDHEQTKSSSEEATGVRSNTPDQSTESKTAESKSDTDTQRSGDIPLIDNRRLVREKSSDVDEEADLSEASKSADDKVNDEERAESSAADDNDESREASNESDRNFPNEDEPKDANNEERADSDDSDSEDIKAGTRRMLTDYGSIVDSKARADDSSQSEIDEVSKTGVSDTGLRSFNPLNQFDSRSNFGSDIIIPQLRPTLTRSGVFYRPSLMSVQSVLPTPNRFNSQEFNSRPFIGNYGKPEPHRPVSSNEQKHMFNPVDHVSNAYPYLPQLKGPQFTTTPKPAHNNPVHLAQFNKDVDNIFLKLAQASENLKPHNFDANRRSFESFSPFNNEHVSNTRQHQSQNKLYNSFDPNHTAPKVYDTYNFARFKRSIVPKVQELNH